MPWCSRKRKSLKFLSHAKASWLDVTCVESMQLQLHGEAKQTRVLDKFHFKLNLFVSARHSIDFLRRDLQQLPVIVFSFFICYRLDIFNSL